MDSGSIRPGGGKKRPRIAVLGVAVSVLTTLCLIVVSCGGSAGTTATTPASIGGSTGVPGGSAQVVLKDFAFDPQTVTIRVGETVTWTNQDSANHTVTGDGGEFESGGLANGDTFSFTFDTAGTHAYHCSIHPSMKGTVIVE